MSLLPFLISVIAFLGDSNIWLGGEDCSQPDSWSHWLVEEVHPEVARSFARSGATITNAVTTPADTLCHTELLNDSNTLYHQAIRIKGAVERGEFPSPDLIILYGGSNDAWFADRRPGLFAPCDSLAYPITSTTLPNQAPTLHTSLRLIRTILKEVNPEAEIIIIGPPYMTKASRDKIKAVADVMEEFSAQEGIKMIRLDTDSLINPDRENVRLTMTRDGVHTTPLGAKIIGHYVYSKAFEEPCTAVQ